MKKALALGLSLCMAASLFGCGSSAEETEVVNGRAVTWETGANTLTVKVTAADGTTTKSYVVTVTKS